LVLLKDIYLVGCIELCDT